MTVVSSDETVGEPQTVGRAPNRYGKEHIFSLVVQTVRATIVRCRQTLLPYWPSISFAVRTTISSMLALYIAFLMQLDSPKWAAMTVWIVAQPSRGMAVAKSRSRVSGTLLGASVGVMLIALFAQQPEVLMIALALWMGLCTAVSTYMSNFRSYGAVLSGYSCVLVVLGVSNDPQHVFDIAVARSSYVILGIVVEAVMTAIFAPGSPVESLIEKTRIAIAGVANICGKAITGESDLDRDMRQAFATAVRLESESEYAAAASGDRKKIGETRTVIGGVLSQLAAAQALNERRRELRAQHGDEMVLEHEQLFRDANVLLSELAASKAALLTSDVHRRTALALRGKIHKAVLEESGTGGRERVEEYGLLSRLDELVDGVVESLNGFSALQSKADATERSGVSFHRDATFALINGLRSIVAIVGAAAFWLWGGWTSGSGFVTIVGVICSLFASRDNPVVGSMMFFRGCLLATVCAGICNFIILPYVDSFEILLMVIVPFLLVGAMAFNNPRFAGIASAYLILFLSLLAPSNTVRPDPVSFLNSAVATNFGLFVSILVFKVVLPFDRNAAYARLRRAIASDFVRMSRGKVWSKTAWHVRMADRLARQGAWAGQISRDEMQSGFRGTLASLSMGMAVMQLHRQMKTGALPSDAVGAVRILMRRLENLGEAPDKVVRSAHAAAERLVRLAANEPREAKRALMQGASAALDIATGLHFHADFLDIRPLSARPGAG